MLELTEKCKRLYERLMKIPADLDEIRTELETGGYTPDELAAVSCAFVETCYYETWDRNCEDEGDERYIFHMSPAVVIQNEHSTYLRETMKLLLEYGLEPNAIVDDSSILDTIRHINNEYIAADTLALLFEYGAYVNLRVKGERVFENIDFQILFDTVEQNDRRYYDSLVHCWFVWLGYGARLENGESGLELYQDYYTKKEFDLSSLRNHRNFTFGLSHVRCHDENWSLHIFDKRTLWEVARM